MTQPLEAAPCGHQHQPTAEDQARLLRVMAVVLSASALEGLGAWLTHSHALRAEALHMAIDAFALAVSAGGVAWARRSDSGRSRQIEMGAAVVNLILALAVVVEISAEAIAGLFQVERAHGIRMIPFALVALLVNGWGAKQLHRAHGGHSHAHGPHDVNMRSAELHLLGDAAGALSAFAVGVALEFGAPAWLDSAAALVVAAAVLGVALGLIRDLWALVRNPL